MIVSVKAEIGRAILVQHGGRLQLKNLRQPPGIPTISWQPFSSPLCPAENVAGYSWQFAQFATDAHIRVNIQNQGTSKSGTRRVAVGYIAPGRYAQVPQHAI
jgi:hypothetical protein